MPASAPLAGDARSRGLALSNLLANAADFGAGAGSARRPRHPARPAPAAGGVSAVSGWHLALRDRGPGVPDYAWPQLGTARFFSTPRRRDGRKGSGLGLAIARRVAELHGGAAPRARRAGAARHARAAGALAGDERRRCGRARADFTLATHSARCLHCRHRPSRGLACEQGTSNRRRGTDDAISLLSKVLAIGLVMLLMAALLTRIGWLVDERQGRRQEAVASVKESVAAAQTLLGPIVQRRCTERGCARPAKAATGAPSPSGATSCCKPRPRRWPSTGR
ncbi:MAG: inner membrane CreD family protein [Rubrivivax sp.]